MVIERKKLMDIILLDQKNNILKIRLNGDFEMENNIDSEEYIRIYNKFNKNRKKLIICIFINKINLDNRKIK